MSINPSSSSLAVPVAQVKTATSLPAPAAPPTAIVEFSPEARKAFGGALPQPTNIIWGSAPNR